MNGGPVCTDPVVFGTIVLQPTFAGNALHIRPTRRGRMHSFAATHGSSRVEVYFG